jgi:endonuclease I
MTLVSKIRVYGYASSIVRNLLIHSNLDRCIYTKIKLNKENFTLEHIIPKSYMPEKYKNHYYNLYPCDKLINSNRSNYKFLETPIDLIDKTEKEGILFLKPNQAVYINKEAQGIVGRRILYFTYLLHTNFDHILEFKLAKKWSRENKPTIDEKTQARVTLEKMRKIKKKIEKIYKDILIYKIK